MNLGFEPVFDPDSRTLILGSFPSVQSRQNNFYYGNPQNRFWKMLAAVYREDLPITVAEKKSLILRHSLALWDVLSECDIRGSADSDINEKNSRPADLYGLLALSSIERILTNGKKAHELLLRHFPRVDIPVIIMPSTSPANTSYQYGIWEKTLLNRH